MISKTGFTANETDTSQDTESSASTTAQEEPSQQSKEGTRDSTNTRTQTSTVLIKMEVAQLIQQDQNKGDETSVYVLPLPPIMPYYCPQYYCVSQNNFRIVGRILCTPTFIPFSVEYLGELPMNID